MKPEKILEEQRIYVKRGRMNGLGFEPAWNAYFDFYLNSKHVDPPLLELEDVTFHLYLRKNLNNSNPDWEMPSVRYMMRRFRIGYAKYAAMVKRLDRAKLLVKISGVRDTGNVGNDYILSDPVPHLDEFLAILDAGLFDPVSETETPPVSVLKTPPVSEIATPPVSVLKTLKQTSLQQTSSEQTDDFLFKAWTNTLEILKQHQPFELSSTLLANLTLKSVENKVAVIAIADPKAKDYIQNRYSKRILDFFNVELRIMEEREIKEIRLVVE